MVADRYDWNIILMLDPAAFSPFWPSK